jgi:hypothetical protein
MIVALVISTVLLVLAVLLRNLISSGEAEVDSASTASAQNYEAELGALALLLSAEEDDYLRNSLPAGEFCAIKRQRVVLARKYVRAMGRGTSRLIRTAEAAKSGNDREVIQAANEVLFLAFRIKLNMPLVHLCLLIEWFFPRLALIDRSRVKPYRQVLERVLFIQKRIAPFAS